MIKELWSRYRTMFFEALRFGIVGGTAQAIHYGVYLAIVKAFDANASLSYTIGYLIAFVANFYLSAYFTFRKRPSWKNMFGMAGAHIINYFMEIGLLNLFLWLGMSKVWAPIPTLAIAVPINFFMVRYVFKKIR